MESCAVIITDDDIPSGSATAGAMYVAESEIGNIGNWKIYLITLSPETRDYSCHTMRTNYKYTCPEYRDHKKIIEEITRHIVDQPQNSRLFLDRGVIFAFIGKFYEAENDFKSAIKFDPDCVEAYISLGSIYSNLNKPEQASRSYTSAMLALKRAKPIYLGPNNIKLYRQAEKGLQKALKKSMKQR